jgi:hypothetical protein
MVPECWCWSCDRSRDFVVKRALLHTASFTLISDHRVSGCLATNTTSSTTSQHLYTMKSSLLLSLCTAALVAGAAHPNEPQVVLQDPQTTFVEPDEYLIELSPGETRWVTEEGKWELRRVCIHLHC